ncbi:MAG: DNA glycosylase [Peptostreptococcaceae bacterium]|nr:DNA glycosylase [Peptostreptococcaceae bacterium]
MSKHKKQIISHENSIYIVGEDDFDPKHIFENGQAFRWDEEDGAYTIVAGRYVTLVKRLTDRQIHQELIEGRSDPLGLPNGYNFQQNDPPSDIESIYPKVIKLENAGTMQDYENFWCKYFDMDRDYKKLRREFSKMDPHLKKAVRFATGFRVLQQDLFEMIISFIISSNNNIGRIKSTISKLCAIAGEPLGEYNGKIRYRFPTPEKIAALSAEQISKETGAGYRGEYIQKTAAMIAAGEVDLDLIRRSSYGSAHEELLKLSGVGPKVADCILLFGNGMDIAFPVDTWVIKLMNHFYLGQEKNVKKIKSKGVELFGEKAGIAQQYLFYYARENKIGTKLK